MIRLAIYYEKMKEYQEALELPSREGVFIVEVKPNTPAEKAGLENGDVIVSLNDVKMKNSNEFMLKIGDFPPDSEIEIEVIHKGKKKKIALTLADRDIIISEDAVNWRGIHVVDLGAPQASNFDLGSIDSGVAIIKIDPDSPAEDTTLESGDVIVEINDETVDNSNDFIKIMDKYKDKKKPILIYRLRRLSNGKIIKGFVPVKYK